MFVSETLTYTSATDAEMPKTDLNRALNIRLCILAITILNFRYYFVEKIPLDFKVYGFETIKERNYSWSYALK